jgi:16S rRNA (guanine527-N7)-methyltransferase
VSDTARDQLERGLERLGFAEPQRLAGRLTEFSELLLAANRETNLVGAKSFDELVGPHLLDSLAPLAGQPLEGPVFDVGSGAGLPGIPAALAWPDRPFILLEPRAKRAKFLAGAVEALHLENAQVRQLSAASAAAGAGLARQAGTLLVRALAKPDVALAASLPLLAAKGRLFLYTGRQARPTDGEMRIIRDGGGWLVEARQVEVPYLDAQRHIWIVTRPPG